MTCPYLTDAQIPTCTASGDEYLPSIFELERYCRSAESKMCPYPSLMLFGIGRNAQCGTCGKESRAA